MSTQEEHSLITLRMSESFLWLRWPFIRSFNR